MIKNSQANKKGVAINLAPLALMGLIIGLFLLTFGVKDSIGQALFKQNREQCDECCKKSGYDDYYLEQCRLKCFRNNDYCMGSKGAHAESASPPKVDMPEPIHRVQEQSEPQVEKPELQPRPQSQKPQFVWPNPLNLTPGREGEAAGHILTLNGIPPQHPNYVQALGAIQSVLTNFARNNPTGGALPTAQLQKIISQMR